MKGLYNKLTIAVMLLPLGPVTLRQAPQYRASDQLLSLSAVPYTPLGSDFMIVNEHAPPLRFPP